jgi:hypothetical protein
MGSSPRREMKSRASERLPWKLIIKRLRVRFSVFTAAVPASGTAAVVIAVIAAVIVANYAARLACHHSGLSCKGQCLSFFPSFWSSASLSSSFFT